MAQGHTKRLREAIWFQIVPLNYIACSSHPKPLLLHIVQGCWIQHGLLTITIVSILQHYVPPFHIYHCTWVNLTCWPYNFIIKMQFSVFLWQKHLSVLSHPQQTTKDWWLWKSADVHVPYIHWQNLGFSCLSKYLKLLHLPFPVQCACCVATPFCLGNNAQDRHHFPPTIFVLD